MIQITISGRVGQDAEITQNGSLRFSLASTEKGFTTKDGKQIPDRTTWFTVFKNNGSKLAPYIKKGSYIVVTSNNVECHVYENKGGLQLNAVSLEFGGNSVSNKEEKPKQENQPEPTNQTTNEPNDLDKTMNKPEEEQDNLPF